MKLERLTIRLMPGIRDVFTVEARPGLNFVVGPNGAGKTTICRAVRALLWPEVETPSRLLVDSRWALAGGAAEAEREGRAKTRWSRDGSPIDAPDRPGAGLARCYTIGLAELFTETATPTDRAIAAEVLRQLAGGYDLDAIAERLFPSPTGKSESGEVKRREEARRGVERERARLAVDEDALEELRGELGAARSAAGRLALLEREREVRDAEAALSLAEQALACHHGTAVERLVGDEPKRLAQLEQRIAETTRELDACAGRMQSADRERREAGLPESGVERHVLEEARKRAGAIGRLEDHLHDRDAECAEARAAVKDAASEIDPAWDVDTIPRFEADAVRAAAAQLRAAAARQREDDGLGSLLHNPALAIEARDADPRALDAGIAELTAWLTASPPAPHRALHIAAIAGSLLAAAGGAAVALTLHGSGWIFVPVALAGAAVAGIVARSAGQTSRAIRDRFAATGVNGPAHWDPRSVERRLDDLRTSRELCEGDRVRRVLRDRFEADRKRLEAERENFARERDRLRERAGAAPDATELDVVEFLRLLDAYRGARRARAAAEKAHEAARNAFEEQLGKLNAVLAAFDYEPARDAASASARIEELVDRDRRLAEARAILDHETPRRDTLAERLDRLRRERDALFTSLDLEPGDAGRLARLIENLEPFRTARGAHERAAAELASARARREQSPLYGRHPEFAELDAAGLLARIEEERKQADRVEELAGRIAVTESEVRSACDGFDQAAARAALDRACAALDERREEALFAAAGQYLLRRTRDTYERKSRPAVEEEASRLFQVFTHGAYRLRVERGDDDRPRFRARETATGDRKTLGQLSDGTRAQLFLAARLAFAFGAERTEKPPLFLDEALSNTDPVRFDRIAASLAAMAETDARQIFYLTSNPADVTAWNAALDRNGRSPIEAFDLARARGMAAAAPGRQLDPPPLPEVPAAAGLDAAAYGARILAPRFDPARKPAETHLFHLLRDDLALLERLLRANVTTVGGWRTFAEGLLKTDEVERSSAERLDARAAALDAFVAAWRVGRGRPVRRAELEATEVVTDRFIEPLADLAAAVDGDPDRLLVELSGRENGVKGFGPDKARRLAESLENSGHLDRRERLSEADVTARVITASLPAIKAGVLTREEVAQLAHALWTGAAD